MGGSKCIYQTEFETKEENKFIECDTYCIHNFDKWFPSLLMEYDSKTNSLHPRLSKIFIEGISKTKEKVEKILIPDKVVLTVHFKKPRNLVSENILPPNFFTNFTFIYDKRDNNNKQWKVDFNPEQQEYPTIYTEGKEILTPKHVKEVLSLYKTIEKIDFSSYNIDLSTIVMSFYYLFDNEKDGPFLEKLDSDRSAVFQMNDKGKYVMGSFDYTNEFGETEEGAGAISIDYFWDIPQQITKKETI